VSNVTPTRWYIDTRGHASDAAFSQVSRSETEVGGIDAVTLTPGRLIELPPIVTNVLHPEAPARVTELANAAAVMPRPLISSKSWPPAGFASKSVMISWPNPAEKKKTSSPAPPFNVSFALPSVRTLARALLSCWARSGEPLTEAPCGVEDPSRARRRTTGRQPRCRPKSPRRRCWRQWPSWPPKATAQCLASHGVPACCSMARVPFALALRHGSGKLLRTDKPNRVGYRAPSTDTSRSLLRCSPPRRSCDPIVP
jgi:hypothetical protein